MKKEREMKRWWWVIGVSLIGCSSSSTTPGSNGTDAGHDATTPDGGGEADSGSDGPSDGGESDGGMACTNIANVGTVVHYIDVPTDQPIAQGGGPPSDGTYVITAASLYTGDGGASGPTSTTIQETVVVSGMSYDQVSAAANGGQDAGVVYQSGHFTVNGAGISIVRVCPSFAMYPFNSYDFDGRRFRIYGPANGPNNPPVVVEYTKQ
jgi:hypothetical protein